MIPYWKSTLNFSHLTSDWNWLYGVLNTVWNCTLNVTLKFNQSFAWFPQKNVTRPAQCSHMGTLLFKIIFLTFAKQVGWNFFYYQTAILLNFKMPYSKKFRSRDFFCYHVTSENGRKSGKSSFPTFFFVWRWRISEFFLMNILPRN